MIISIVFAALAATTIVIVGAREAARVPVRVRCGR
jgi:hypothetical protein